MNNQDIINQMKEEKIILILRNMPDENLIPFCEAVCAGGIHFVELTYDASGKLSDEKNAQSIQRLAEHFAGQMTIGAGTVLKKSQIELTKQAGGKFIISPDVNLEIIRATKEQGLISIPGAFSPSEIITAHNAGADFVKVFPVTTMSSAYIKAITAPISHVPILAVGGVNLDNIVSYLEAGACGAGIGANFVNREFIENNNFEAIKSVTAQYVAAVRGK